MSDARSSSGSRVYAPATEQDVPALVRKSERGFGYATDLHVRNFLECVKTRKEPTAPMRVAFGRGSLMSSWLRARSPEIARFSLEADFT